MPWKEISAMTQKLEFIEKAQDELANISALARQFGISRETAYKWLQRFQTQGLEGLNDKSRKPKSSPKRTTRHIEELVCVTRRKFMAWGPRKLKRWLENQGHQGIPAPSTIAAILKRNGHILEEESRKHKAWKRFEHQSPNDLFQCDFKGWFSVGSQQCHPLTMLDDHSRFCLGIRACPNESGRVVKPHFIDIFRTYGLPSRMTMDNGTPWGAQDHGITRFEVWLIRLGIKVSHSRPNHPQTQGKDERFHRSLKAELLCRHKPATMEEAQQLFDEWRRIYNEERPHEALSLGVPIERYRRSARPYPERLPCVEYDANAQLRKVGHKGDISVGNRRYFISQGLYGEHVELRETAAPSRVSVYYSTQRIKELCLKEK